MDNFRVRLIFFMISSLVTFQVYASKVFFPFEEYVLRSFLSAELYLHEGRQIDYLLNSELKRCGYIHEYEVKNIYSGSADRGMVFRRRAVPLPEGFYYALIFKSKGREAYEKLLSKDDIKMAACYLDKTAEYFDLSPSSVYPVVSDELGRERVFVEIGNPLLAEIPPEGRVEVAKVNGVEGYLVERERVKAVFHQAANNVLKFRDK